MEKEKVYFEESNVIIEKDKKKKIYPLSNIRYKRTSFVYKNPSFAPSDGRRKEEFLEIYYKNKIITIINSNEYELGDLIRTYNLKVLSETEDELIYVKKSFSERFTFAFFVFLAIISLPIFLALWLENCTSVKYNLMSISILLFVILSIVGYEKNNYKLYFNEERIELHYGTRKKVYKYDQITDYNVVQSFFNNKLETLVIWFEDGEEIRINEEYENFNNFFQMLNEKAYSNYM